MRANDLYPSLLPSGLDVETLSLASQFLVLYGALMWLACGIAYIISRNDGRTLRRVGVWVKPMKFMSSTALFAWTTVWVAELANAALTHGQAYVGICALLVVTSLFEVVYITHQASKGMASHYNTSDAWHGLMFALMAVGAVGLTGSQAWLAWEIWQSSGTEPLPVTAWGVVVGLVFTFVLSTISGFMLGGKQPPAGPGLPVVGWHLAQDIRPSHFMGVHAQQFIPLLGLCADRFLGAHAGPALAAACTLYATLWGVLTARSLKDRLA